ncbi:MAG TPA: ABC transporter permease [Spirochaetota bacterium]|nr:ABC transporter permease [Spirochaetota bacterium]HRZ28065.1 ABC transporter permease [Spirochaetota bacterium]HSA13912.1 ABC transporter permease [Spirochaetota bacterium]
MNVLKPVRRTLTIAGKEWIHIRRDSRSLILSLIAPALLVLLFGYALNMDVKNVKTVVLDHDRTAFTRQFVERFSHTEYIRMMGMVDSYKEIDDLIDSGDAVMAIVIPPRFTADVKSGKRARIQVLVDGSDSMSSTVAVGYVRAITTQFNIETQIGSLGEIGITGARLPIDVRSRVWYNEEMLSKNFVIPGIIVIILAIIAALITSLTISREWERGTMETLITTPVRPAEIMIGKIIPYLVIGAFDVAMALALGSFIFDIHMRGSFLELLALSMVFLTGMSALGMVISSVTRVQVLSIQAAMIVTYLPSFILSGFVFPVKNMPVVIQAITYLIPAKYMIAIIKGIALKGVPATLLHTQVAFMVAFAVFMLLLCVKKIRLTIPE